MAIVGFDYFNLLSANPAGYSGPLGVRRRRINDKEEEDYDDEIEVTIFSSLQHIRNISIQVCATAVFSCQLMVKTAAQVADVALGADEENGDLQGTALDDYQADDVTLLLCQRLVGLVHGILLLEGSK